MPGDLTGVVMTGCPICEMPSGYCSCNDIYDWDDEEDEDDDEGSYY